MQDQTKKRSSILNIDKASEGKQSQNYFKLFFLYQEKFTDEPALGYTDAGITFVIHSPKELPRFDGLGLLTPVGTHAQVAIRQLKVRTLSTKQKYWSLQSLTLF